MISSKTMTKILKGNFEKELSRMRTKWLQERSGTSATRNFFMFILLISNHTAFFSFNLKLIYTCEFFKKLKLHSLWRLSDFWKTHSCKLNSKPYDYLYKLKRTSSVSWNNLGIAWSRGVSTVGYLSIQCLKMKLEFGRFFFCYPYFLPHLIFPTNFWLTRF